MRIGGFGTPMAARRTGLDLPLPLQFLAAWLAVWLGRVLQEQVEYLKAENLILREKLGHKRVSLTDAERRTLATLGKALGRKGLAAVATIASPETILRWLSLAKTPSAANDVAVTAICASSWSLSMCSFSSDSDLHLRITPVGEPPWTDLDHRRISQTATTAQAARRS